MATLAWPGGPILVTSGPVDNWTPPSGDRLMQHGVVVNITR